MEFNYLELQDYYNEYLNCLPNYKVIHPFLVNVEKEFFLGEISSEITPMELIIQVKIPLNYPYENISFRTSSIKNYPHLILSEGGNSSWFCLNPAFAETIDQQLDLEFDKLGHWISEFIILGKEEHHYDYIIHGRAGTLINFYFDELENGYSDERFKKNKGNTFVISVGKNLVAKDWDGDLIYLDSIDKGLVLKEEPLLIPWYFRTQPPINGQGKLFSNWEEIKESDLFSPEEIQEIDIVYPSINKSGSLDSEKLIPIKNLIVGYKIPLKEGFEVHWEFLYLIDIEGSGPIPVWCETFNINRNRYFGRGSLSTLLCEKGISVIGVGAIGSVLCEILVRGGISKLSFSDSDHVVPGNICRSNYTLQDVNEKKVRALAMHLKNINPKLLLGYSINSFPIPSSNQSDLLKIIQDFYANYDLIFDCTASNELLHYFSSSELFNDKIYYNLAITNEAKSLICIKNTNGIDMYDLRRILLSIEGQVDNFFYEGTGCYYPTFKASYCDINALLNLAVKKISKDLSENGVLGSFVLKYNENGIQLDRIVNYLQRDLEITLSVNQSFIDEVTNQARYNFPFEVGGYIVGGYSKNGKNIFIYENIIAESQHQGRISYRTADINDVHKKIKELFDKSSGVLDYIGEWHTHPNMTNDYSLVDFESIRSQAISKNISTNNPLLLIVAVYPHKTIPCFRIFYNNTLYDFEPLKR